MCYVAGDLYSDHSDNSSCRCFCWRRSHCLMNVHHHSIRMDFGRYFVMMIHAMHRVEMVSAEPVDVDCFGAATVAAMDYCYSWRNSVRVLDYRNQTHHCVCVIVRVVRVLVYFRTIVYVFVCGFATVCRYVFFLPSLRGNLQDAQVQHNNRVHGTQCLLCIGKEVSYLIVT